MVDVAQGLRTVFWSYKKKSPLDGPVFKLHYRLVVGLLLLASSIVLINNYVTSPIQCTKVGESLWDVKEESAMNSYCWNKGTFSVPQEKNKTSSGNREKDRYRTALYQWVPLFLCIQAFFFHLPHNLWKTFCEGGVMKKLVKDEDQSSSDEDHKKFIVQYLKNNKNDKYYYLYSACESLNLVNDVVMFSILTWLVDLDMIFPRVITCEFPLGENGQCVMAMNFITESMYKIMRYCLIPLVIITLIQVIVRLAQGCSTEIRSYFLSRRTMATYEEIRLLLTGKSSGDWYILYRLSQHINEPMFVNIIKDLNSEELGTSRINLVSTG